MRRSTPLAPCALALVLAACGATADASSTGSRGRVPEWHLPDHPAVRIGVAEGDPDYVLYRVAAGVRLDDGRIVVANGGGGELRVYDAAGRFVRRFGREGRGPGEFESLAWVGRLPGDTLVAWDGGLLRWSVFTADGRLVRTVTPRPEPPGMFPQVRGALDDGSLVVSSGWNVPGLAASRPGVRQDSVTLLRYGRDGALAGTLARLPGNQEYVARSGGSFSTHPYPFARELFVAAAGARVYVGNSEQYRVRMLDPGGRVVGEAAQPVSPAAVTAADRERYRRDRLSRIQVESYRRQQEQILAQVPFPETFPAFAALRVDAAGNAWIADYTPPGQQGTWSVFDPTGHLQATVHTPAELEVMQVGADFVLGRATDQDGTEQVRLYPLRRE
ncbi:MAG TPA: hypothetical protein VFJ82_11760 [Longimicrobium sp.]|nr:hypothetical protein [Longimicrobium sp.]